MKTNNYKELVAESMDDATFWNVHDSLKNENIESLQIIQRCTSLPFSVCALSITGDLNVGMIARTACIFGAREFIVFGRRKYDKRSTVGAQNYMPVTRVDGFDTGTELSESKFFTFMHDNKYTPIFVEQGGDRLTKVMQLGWTKYLTNSIVPGTIPCLVFGNENEGVPETFMKPEYARISIDQRGVLRSLNVSSAASIVIHSLATHLSSNIPVNYVENSPIYWPDG